MRSELRTSVLLTIALLLVSCAPNHRAEGGVAGLPSKAFAVADFNALEVGSALQVQITQGDAFKVTVYADKNLLDHVRVNKVGSALRLRLDDTPVTLFGSHSAQVHVVMPRLEELRVEGASHAEIVDFTARQAVAIHVSGASQVQGQLAGQNVKLDVSGASTVRLDGSAENLICDASGASRLDLRSFRVSGAQAALSGASSAQVHATDKLGYRLSGASRLTYQGRPAIETAEVTGGSSVNQ